MVKNCFKALLLLIFWIPVNIYSQAPSWSWHKTIHSQDNEMITDCEIDSLTGDILMAGDFDGDLSSYLGDGTSTSTDFSTTYGGTDGLVARYDRYGNSIWAFRIGGSENDRVNSIDIAPSGEIYVTGYISNGICDFTGTGTETTDKQFDNTYGQTIFIAKYNANGELLWYRIGETPDGNAEGKVIRADRNGVYVSGNGTGSVTFGNFSMNLTFGGHDFFILKYNPDGTEEYYFSGGTSEDDKHAEIQLDKDFLYVVVNYRTDQLYFNDSTGYTMFTPSSNSYPDHYQISISSFSRSDVDIKWYTQITGNSDSRCNGFDIITDSLYLTGSLGSDTEFPKYSNNPVNASDKSDIFISSMPKFPRTGWVKTIDGTDTLEQGKQIVNIGTEHLIVTGNYSKTLDFWGDTSITSTDKQDVFMMALTSGGGFQWAKNIGGNNNEYSQGIDGNNYGEIYTSGYYQENIQFDAFTSASDNKFNAFLGKLDLNLNEEPLPIANAGIDQSLCEDSNTFMNGNSPSADYTASWSYLPDIIWKENFNDLADGTTQDTSSSSEWSLIQDASNGYAKVRSHKFEVNAPDIKEVIWQSETIDISGYNNADIQIDLESWTDGEFETEDSIVVSYKIDGGSETVLTNGKHKGAIGNITGAGSGGYHSATATASGLNGDSLDIILKAFCNEDSEIYRFDNILVTASSSGDDPNIASPNDPGTEVTQLQYGANQFMWSFTHDTLPASRDMVQITRYQQPVADPGEGGDTCGLDFKLQAVFSTASDSGYWEKTAGPGKVTAWADSTADTTLVTVSQEGSYHFTWTEVNGSCQDDSTITVEFNKIPLADPGENDGTCGLEFELQAVFSTVSDSGYWEKTTGPGEVTAWTDSTADTTFVTVNEYGSYEFTWTEVNGSCQDDSTVTVEFNKIPLANPGEGGDTCGLDFKLQAVFSSASDSGYWEKTAGPGKVTAWADSTADTTLVTVSQEGSYDFTWTEVNGSCQDDSTITVEFYQLPDAEAGEDMVITKGGEARLDASGGENYLWWPTEGLSDTAIADPIAGPDTTTTYSVRVTNAEGCSDTARVTVKVIPGDFARAAPDTAICRGNSVQLNASGGESYQWKPAEGLSNAETANPKASPEDTTTYQVIVSKEENITDTAYITIEVKPLPELSIQEEYELCEGDTIRLTAEGKGDFQWSPEEGLSRTDIPDPLAFPLNNATYRVALTNEHQCTQTSKTKVRVYQKPNAYAGSDQTLNYKFETNLNASTPVTGTGEWSAVKGNAEFEDKSEPKTTVSGLELEENVLLWSVDNGVCPVSKDRIHIIVKDLFTPTVITPNNDGKNDHFRVPGLENTECKEFIVFNRWGKEIYRERDYQGDWDGINKWGEKVTPDTYYYIMKLKSGRVLKGYFDIAH